MTTTNFRSMEDFVWRAPVKLTKGLETLGESVVSMLIDEMGKKAVAISPVGPSKDAARRRAAHGGDIVYGHLRDNWRKLVGGKHRPLKSKVKVKAGKKVGLINRAAHAAVVDGGRRRSSSGQLGSSMAPRGLGKPLLEWAQANGERIQKKAIKAAERAMR